MEQIKSVSSVWLVLSKTQDVNKLTQIIYILESACETCDIGMFNPNNGGTCK